MDRTKHTRVVSSTPERTRIQVSPKRRTQTEMHRIAEGIKGSPHVHDVRMNVRTGSLVIRHAPGTEHEVRPMLEDLGIILASTLDIELPSARGTSGMASRLIDAVSDLDHRLGFATSGILDLRTLVPLGLGGLAFYQLLRRGLQVEAAPWYFLAYLAFDSFVKLHYPPTQALPHENR